MVFGHLCPVFHSPSPPLPHPLSHLIFLFPVHFFFSFMNPLSSYSIFKICFRKRCQSITQNSPLRMLESGSVLSYTPGELFDHMAVGHRCLFLFLKVYTLQRRTTSSLDLKNLRKREWPCFTMYVSLCTHPRGRKPGFQFQLQLLSIFIPVIY